MAGERKRYEELDDIRDIISKRLARYCPRCGGKIARIQYGLPTPEALEKAKHRDDIILGGCCVGEEAYRCRKCGAGLDEDMRITIWCNYLANDEHISAPGIKGNDGTIILTSCGFDREFGPFPHDEFNIACHKVIGGDMEKKRVLNVITAADGEDGNKGWMWVEERRMERFGFNPELITEYKIGDELNADDFDVMYLMGGNSYYLLDMIRKYHFDKVIQKFLKDGKVVIGSSAGSQVLGTSVKVSADENKIGMTDFKALGLVDALVIPHENQKPGFIKEWREKTDERIITLTDYSGIIVTNKTWKELDGKHKRI